MKVHYAKKEKKNGEKEMKKKGPLPLPTHGIAVQ